jgi:glycosyltransferase involved in cell wall biosynthesis
MKLSILIPAYNSATTIVETLQSLDAQSTQSRRHISRVVLADDGSTDDTILHATQSWLNKSIKLEVWRSDTNRGERATVNAAFRRMIEENEDWCAILHADDLAKPHWLDSLCSRTSRVASNTVSICSSWDSWYPQKQVIFGEDNEHRDDEIVWGTIESTKGTFSRGCWWHFSGSLMNLNEFEQVGPFLEDMPQLGDFEWLIRALLKGKHITYVPRTLISYRCSEGNVSSVSFRTNRDQKEAIQICQHYYTNPRLTLAVANYARTNFKRALYRCLTSAARFQWQRSLGSLINAQRLLPFCGGT